VLDVIPLICFSTYSQDLNNLGGCRRIARVATFSFRLRASNAILTGLSGGGNNQKMSFGSPPLQRPLPRRPFELHASNAPTPEDSSPPSPEFQPSLTGARSDGRSETDAAGLGRTDSVMDLTSSTLYGIYSPTGYSNEREEPSTPWGTGDESQGDTINENSLFSLSSRATRPPIRRRSSHHVIHMTWPNYLANLTLRTVLLFCIGMGYGLLVTRLHDDQQLAPFPVEGIIKPSYYRTYLIFWGIVGVGLGSLLPWVDGLWEDPTLLSDSVVDDSSHTGEKDETVIVNGGLTQDWNPAVRSIGAFVGIAFAIRKLPWSSTLQVSLTLALVNPVLWYLVDRSKTGFFLSAAVGLIGTAALLFLNPEMMPSPAVAPSFSARINNVTAAQDAETYSGLISQETFECGTWIISVLFCSCVCFGNIGRWLALRRGQMFEKGGGVR